MCAFFCPAGPQPPSLSVGRSAWRARWRPVLAHKPVNERSKSSQPGGTSSGVPSRGAVIALGPDDEPGQARPLFSSRRGGGVEDIYRAIGSRASNETETVGTAPREVPRHATPREWRARSSRSAQEPRISRTTLSRSRPSRTGRPLWRRRARWPVPAPDDCLATDGAVRRGGRWTLATRPQQQTDATEPWRRLLL